MDAFALFIIFGLVSGVHPRGDIAFVFICQDHENSLRNCQEQSQVLRENDFPVVFSTDFELDGDWTIFPLVSVVNEQLTERQKWIMFCTEHTVIDLQKLTELVGNFDPIRDMFVGRALTDPGPVIIHHFSSNSEFQFPLLPAGFLLSRSLFKKIVDKLDENFLLNDVDFSIDASYEFSLFVTQLGCNLTHSDRFCLQNEANCVTYVSQENGGKIKSAVKRSELFFAVKTCKKFHNDRLPIVEATWARETKKLAYYSDGSNDEIPTIVSNVTNADHGHCEKTYEILDDLRKKMKNDRTLKWAVISDDDTILSVARIVDLLRNFNASDALALGERYGYNLLKNGGYNYLTGGGGVILSRTAVKKFKKTLCACPSSTTPDDMFLFGVCLKRLEIRLIHVPTMHQARPNDYSPEFLSIGKQISFHKHWMIDPKRVYQKWFKSEHDEL